MTESNESNNVAYTTINITGIPDLVITSQYAPSTATTGSTVSISAYTYNQGSAAAGSNYVRYWLSDDAILNTSSDRSLGYNYVGNLSVGTSEYDSLSFTYDASWGTGTKYIFFEADGYGYVTESNESNNVAYTTINISSLSHLLNVTDSLFSDPNGSQQDIFNFSVSQSGYVSLKVFNMSQDVNLLIYDASNNLVGYDREWGTNTEDIKLWLDAGSYTAKTYLYGGDALGTSRSTNYQLTADFLGGTYSQPLDITINASGLSSTQQQLINLAASYWEGIILGLPGNQQQVIVPIDFSIQQLAIDIAGSASSIFSSDGLPQGGNITFNSLYTSSWDSTEFFSVALHEIGHQMGIGTSPLWKNLVSNHRFMGLNSSHVYGDWLRAKQWRPTTDGGFGQPILPLESSIYVPITNTGNSGSLDAHWDEDIFDRENMTDTSELNGVITPLSYLTVSGLKDIGYSVNFAKTSRLDIFNQLSQLGVTWNATYNSDYYVSDIQWNSSDTRIQSDLNRTYGDIT